MRLKRRGEFWRLSSGAVLGIYGKRGLWECGI